MTGSRFQDNPRYTAAPAKLCTCFCLNCQERFPGRWNLRVSDQTGVVWTDAVTYVGLVARRHRGWSRSWPRCCLVSGRSSSGPRPDAAARRHLENRSPEGFWTVPHLLWWNERRAKGRFIKLNFNQFKKFTSNVTPQEGNVAVTHCIFGESC